MIRINDLLLRIPGLSRDEAENLGREIAKRIASGLPPGVGSRYINGLELQLSVPNGTSHTGMAEKISKAILERIG
jgi:hypothetical protein